MSKVIKKVDVRLEGEDMWMDFTITLNNKTDIFSQIKNHVNKYISNEMKIISIYFREEELKNE